jgi:hypothetical protein
VTTLFTTICAIALLFFLVFFVQCARIKDGYSKRPQSNLQIVGKRTEPRDDFDDGSCAFTNADEETSHILDRQNRTAEALVASTLFMPLIFRRSEHAWPLSQRTTQWEQQRPRSCRKTLAKNL